MRNLLLFANPIAGKGKALALAERIIKRLRRSGLNVEPVFDKPEDLTRLPPGPIDAAISIGGDGTLRAMVTTLSRLLGFRNLPPVVVAPLGTANLMARHLALPWVGADDPEEGIARCLQRHNVLHLDAATANDSLFLLIASVGIDAQIVHELSRSRRGAITHLSYAMPAALSMLNFEMPQLTVEADGNRLVDATHGMVFVGNVKEYGTGFPILPHANSTDGLLDVCILPCRTRAQVVKWILRTTTGDHARSEGAIYVKVRDVSITTPTSAAAEIDGDAGGFTPLRIRLLDEKVPFIVPA